MADAVQPQLDDNTLFEMSEEDFLKAMEAAKVAATDQPRDEQGRFAKVDTVETIEETEPEPVDQVIYRKEIDLKDGSGVQVFEAESLEGVIDKLVEAQENATRKIRELSAAKQAKAIVPADTPLDEAAEFVLSNELMSKPSVALRRQLETMLGMPVEEFKQSVAEAKKTAKDIREHKNAVAFVKSHPEFVPNVANGDKIEKYVQLYFGGDGSPENIEKAYTELKDSGLLEIRSDETPEPTQVAPAPQRIAAPAGVRTVVIQKKAASGLSTKRSVSAPVPPSVEDLYNMPMEEFEKLGGRSSQDNW